jgi:hypothetical protein
MVPEISTDQGNFRLVWSNSRVIEWALIIL